MNEWAPYIAISGFTIAMLFMAGMILFEDRKSGKKSRRR